MNPDFFLPRAKAIILMAPVASVADVQSTGVAHIKDNKAVVAALEKMGPELFCKPRVANISIINNTFAGFFKMSGIGNISLKEAIDKNPAKNMNADGMKTLVGHAPAGTSFRCLNHFR
jgi:hypothetical protein